VAMVVPIVPATVPFQSLLIFDLNFSEFLPSRVFTR
jgi:hypothetical protein